MDKQVMTKAKFRELIEELEIAIRYRLNEKEFDVYYAHLKSLPEDVMADRVKELVLTNKFFPKVSEIWNGYTTDRWRPSDPEEQRRKYEELLK